MLGDDVDRPGAGRSGCVAVASVGTDVDYDRVRAAVPQRGDTAAEATVPVRARRVPRPRSRSNAPSISRCRGEVKTPGRAVPAQSLHRQPPQRRRWRGSAFAGSGPNWSSDSRTTRSCGWSVRSRTLTEPHVVADVQGFFAEHPIPQAAKTLEQILERQRVNADLRERESEPLAEALADSDAGQRSKPASRPPTDRRRGGHAAPSCRTCRRWSSAPRR